MQEASLERRARSIVEEWLRSYGYSSVLKALQQSTQLVTISEDAILTDGNSEQWRRRAVLCMIKFLEAGEREKFWAQVRSVLSFFH